LEDFLKDKPGLEIIHSTLKNIDTLTLPVKEIYDVKIREHIEKLGDELLIYPFLYERIEENPFKLDHREYPIDFGYATEKNVIINITLPDNYEIVEIPEATKVNLPDYSGYFLFQCNALGNLINLNYKYYINKELFVPEEYPYIKEFMNQIIKLHAKPIVVKAL